MLKIHFLNVGHGDCCLVEFIDNSRVAMIDINRTAEMDKNSVKEIYESSFQGEQDINRWLFEAGVINSSVLLEKAGYDIQLQDPLEYLKNNNITSIFRYISTHPHIDHLSGFHDLITNLNIYNLWIIKNSYTQDEEKLTESQKKDWKLYKKFCDTSNNEIDGITVIRPEEGSKAEYYTQDNISILAPNAALKKEGESNTNEMSYVLLITYNGRKILLPGDAEEKTWKHIVENYSSEIKGIDILKAAHHGRDSGYYQPAVKIMSPTVTIVSVGKKPDTDASNKYKQYSNYVWSTRWKGNIVFTIDDNGKISYDTQYER